MMSKMLRVARKKIKVFRMVISLDFVYMMNNFFWGQKSIQYFFSYQPMFANIAAFFSEWMGWRMDHNIAILRNTPTSFPHRMFIAGNIGVFSALIPRFHTLFKFSMRRIMPAFFELCRWRMSSPFNKNSLLLFPYRAICTAFFTAIKPISITIKLLFTGEAFKVFHSFKSVL